MSVTLALNQSLKTLSYRSKIQRFDYKSECKVDKDRHTVKLLLNTNRTSNVDIELQRQSSGSYEIMRTPCASQCNFTLNTDHMSADGDTTFNILINFDDTQVVMSKCETVDNRTQVQRLHEAKILNCKRISEAHIQLKVFHNWTEALELQPNGSHDLWFHVDYKYLNDVGFKTVVVRKENDLQVQLFAFRMPIIIFSCLASDKRMEREISKSKYFIFERDGTICLRPPRKKIFLLPHKT
jgi:hypothetical protein